MVPASVTEKIILGPRGLREQNGSRTGAEREQNGSGKAAARRGTLMGCRAFEASEKSAGYGVPRDLLIAVIMTDEG